MKPRWWHVAIIVALMLSLSACGRAAGVSPTLAAEETASVRGGGGGGVTINGQYVEGLVVVGSGTASADPEVAQVAFGVDLRGDDPAALVDQAATDIDQAIAAALDLGVASEDIRTTGYSLWVETIYDPETGTPTGETVYHLSHYVEVSLRELDRVGELLAQVVEAGVNAVTGVSFTVDDPEALMEQARQLALEDARTRAAAMAEALDITLGTPTLVMEGAGAVPFLASGGMGGGGGYEVAAPSVSPGTFSVSVSVQVVYEIR